MLKQLGIGLVTIGAATTGVYLQFVRPWYRNGGATKVELKRVMPGDAEIEEPTLFLTRAVTIKVCPEDIWPWLIQIGYKKAGFYTYDRFEKLMGIPITNRYRIIPEYQQLNVGEAIALGSGIGINVKAIDPNRSLLLVGREPNIGEVSWVFELYPLSGGHTRLVTRANCRFPNWTLRSVFSRPPHRPDIPTPNLLHNLTMYLFFKPGSFLMVRKMMLGIKLRAESSFGQQPEPVIKMEHDAYV
jgi:hypothetical protein